MQRSRSIQQTLVVSCWWNGVEGQFGQKHMRIPTSSLFFGADDCMRLQT